MDIDLAGWRHVTKLDPDRDNTEDLIHGVCTSGTDAVILGGTQGITDAKMKELLDSVEDYGLDVAVEPSNPDSVVQNNNYLFVPTVLNTTDTTWIIGLHKEWFKAGSDVDWDRVLFEGYIVLNPDSAVAKLTQSDTELSPEDAAGYAEAGVRVFNLPVIYVEYSGTYGDPEVVEAVSEVVGDTSLFYGGGIDDEEKAEEMARFADTVIVGNVVYEDGVDALVDTVNGVKSAVQR